MKSYKTEGLVIKRVNYNEADRIITIFSKKHGKIKLKAAGVRRITSRRSPHIELLNYSTFGIYQGRGMPVLTEAENIESYPVLKKDLKKIGLAYHVCELVDGLCAENQESLEIFTLLLKTLREISFNDNLSKIAYDFEIELLRLLGFYTLSEPDLPVDTQRLIENILERKLKTKQILPQFTS